MLFAAFPGGGGRRAGAETTFGSSLTSVGFLARHMAIAVDSLSL